MKLELFDRVVRNVKMNDSLLVRIKIGFGWVRKLQGFELVIFCHLG